jgi:hypothetical protein
MIFVYSIRDMFVCSLVKTFGHLSDTAKKIVIDSVLTLEHYTPNKVFVSPVVIGSQVRGRAPGHLAEAIALHGSLSWRK